MSPQNVFTITPCECANRFRSIHPLLPKAGEQRTLTAQILDFGFFVIVLASRRPDKSDFNRRNAVEKHLNFHPPAQMFIIAL